MFTMVFTAVTPMKTEIIVPLDVESERQAKSLADTLAPSILWFKVGFELFTATGPSIVNHLTHCGKMVFLDLKLHDIPNTVARAVTAAARHHVGLLTVHASGGVTMMTAAVKAAREAGDKRPQLLAVTTLTSMDQADLLAMGIDRPLRDHTLQLATQAIESGIDGLVCSPHEVEMLRKHLGEKILIVTPGVRPAGAAVQDQKRVATPAEATRAGANFLVIGRPITGAVDPLAAVADIRAEINQVSS